MCLFLCEAGAQGKGHLSLRPSWWQLHSPRGTGVERSQLLRSQLTWEPVSLHRHLLWVLGEERGLLFLLCVSQELCFLVGLFRGSWFLWNPGVPESVTHVANEKLMPMMLNDMSRSQRGRVVPQCPHQPAQQQLLGPALSRSLEVNVFQVFMHVTLTSLYIEVGLCVVGLPWCPC